MTHWNDPSSEARPLRLCIPKLINSTNRAAPASGGMSLGEEGEGLSFEPLAGNTTGS